VIGGVFGISKQAASYYNAIIEKLADDVLKTVENTLSNKMQGFVDNSEYGLLDKKSNALDVIDWSFRWFSHITPLPPKYQRLIVQKILDNKKVTGMHVEVNVMAWAASNMTDEEAHSLLLLSNDQSELSPLEKGKHAYEHLKEFPVAKGGTDADGDGIAGGIRLYAKLHGLPQSSVDVWYDAYRVYEQVSRSGHLPELSSSILYEISKSPQTAWQALCECAVSEEWTVKDTQLAAKCIDRSQLSR